MAKLTYSEQLRHPNWQRKRLHMLEAAGWQCVCCETKETTLHVHHKQYIKGRMAWEYEDLELEVLCEDCHKRQHGVRDAIASIVSADESIAELAELHALIAGFRGRLVESEGIPAAFADAVLFDGESPSRAYWLGQAARNALGRLSAEQVDTLFYAVTCVEPNALAQGLRELINAHPEAKNNA